ncbi:unnamed protein product, partial [Discosporangium mesarthrocarpum]
GEGHGNERFLPMPSAEGVEPSLGTFLDLDCPLGTNLYRPSPDGALDKGAKGLWTPAMRAAEEALEEAARGRPDIGPHGCDSESKAMGGVSTASAGLELLAALVGASRKEKG